MRFLSQYITLSPLPPGLPSTPSSLGWAPLPPLRAPQPRYRHLHLHPHTHTRARTHTAHRHEVRVDTKEAHAPGPSVTCGRFAKYSFAVPGWPGSGRRPSRTARAHAVQPSTSTASGGAGCSRRNACGARKCRPVSHRPTPVRSQHFRRTVTGKLVPGVQAPAPLLGARRERPGCSRSHRRAPMPCTASPGRSFGTSG